MPGLARPDRWRVWSRTTPRVDGTVGAAPERMRRGCQGRLSGPKPARPINLLQARRSHGAGLRVANGREAVVGEVLAPEVGPVAQGHRTGATAAKRTGWSNALRQPDPALLPRAGRNEPRRNSRSERREAGSGSAGSEAALGARIPWACGSWMEALHPAPVDAKAVSGCRRCTITPQVNCHLPKVRRNDRAQLHCA